MLFRFRRIFRLSELVNIQPSHLTFHDEFIKVFVPRRKTDVYREGNYCPVSILRSYVDAAGLDLAICLPLFRSLTKKKAGHSLREGKLSYTRCREKFKVALKDLGYSPKDDGLHSLRFGSITSVVANDTFKNRS